MVWDQLLLISAGRCADGVVIDWYDSLEGKVLIGVVYNV